MFKGGITNESFFNNLTCVDVGCGPMGSLTWLTNAKERIGIGPLANEYKEFGIENHDMLYIKANAEEMPLPDSYVDVVFSMNSLDHVDSPKKACAEIRRILKPGAYFIGSINLDESPTLTESHTLTETFLNLYLFYGWPMDT